MTQRDEEPELIISVCVRLEAFVSGGGINLSLARTDTTVGSEEDEPDLG